MSVQITVTEHQMVKMALLLFQNLAAPASTTGRTSRLPGSGQDSAIALTCITSNFKAKGTWLLPGLLIILCLYGMWSSDHHVAGGNRSWF